MRAAIFETPGLDNLKVVDYAEDPKMKNRDILIKIKTAGVNPIDNLVVSGMLPNILPFPHIPGAESSGIVEQIGSHVSNDNIKVGDRVVVHNKVFDGTCDMCLNGLDMICRNGGLIGAITNGGFAEYISVPERNVFKIPNDLNWDIGSKLACNFFDPLSCPK